MDDEAVGTSSEKAYDVGASRDCLDAEDPTSHVACEECVGMLLRAPNQKKRTLAAVKQARKRRRRMETQQEIEEHNFSTSSKEVIDEYLHSVTEWMVDLLNPPSLVHQSPVEMDTIRRCIAEFKELTSQSALTHVCCGVCGESVMLKDCQQLLFSEIPHVYLLQREVPRQRSLVFLGELWISMGGTMIMLSGKGDDSVKSDVMVRVCVYVLIDQGSRSMCVPRVWHHFDINGSPGIPLPMGCG